VSAREANLEAKIFFSPVETRRLLGCSRALLRKYERKGRLHPVRDARGDRLYARAEVLRLCEQRSSIAHVEGQVAARVFDLFNRGTPLPDIVIETGLPPRTVRALFREYTTPLRAPRAARSNAAAGEPSHPVRNVLEGDKR
jgi:MerR HTH family regulatory protein